MGQAVPRLHQQGHRPLAVLPAGEGLPRPVHRVGEPLGVAQHLPALGQLLVLPLPQLSLFQLLNLIGEGIHPPGLFPVVHLELIPLPAQLPHLGIGRAECRQAVLCGAEAVQIAQMAFLVQQLLAVVLAVDVHQLPAQLPQLRHQQGPPVHPAGIFPVCLDGTLNEQLPVFVGAHPLFLKPGQCGQVLKQGGHTGGCCPGADQIAAGALPHNGPDGVDDNGFARAGLAG